MKILPVGAKVFHADRQTEEWTERRTDRHGEANSLFFHNFANAPEDRKHMVSHHMRQYGNLLLSSKLDQYCSAGFERAQNMAKL